MLDDFVRDSRGRARLRGTGLAASLEAFSAYLGQCGHAANTIAAYRHVAGHFARWLAVRKVSLRRVDEATVWAFTHRHLPQCRCPRPGPRTLFSVRAALHHWLIVLRRDGSAPPPASGTPAAIARAVADFDAFLADTCGLAEATRGYRRRYVREFLQVLFGGGPIEPGRLRAADIERYVVARARRCSAGSAQVIASSIRSWLRFQQMLGASHAQLVAAVPRIPRWRLASLPTVLDDADLFQLLAACNRPTPTGRRDYAMARCLVDLGLRAHEVAGLELCDLDWRRGAIRVPASKVRRADWLPLPETLGRAIVDYLRKGRPPTAARALFVRHKLPTGAPIRPSVVRIALRRAATAAGLEPRWRGPHTLRHTTATRLLRGGASLKEVADLLRHRSFDTTAIYAKVDRQALVQVALPWPGDAR